MEPSLYEDGYQSIRIGPGLAGLSEDKILAATIEAKRQRITLRQSVLLLGFVTEAELLAAVAEKTGLCFIENINGEIDPEAPEAVSANVASHYNIMPLGLRENKLQIATADPFNPNLVNEIELVLNNAYKIELVLATSEHIVKAIRTTYGVGAATVEQMVTDEQVDSTVSGSEDITEENMARQASVIKLVNQILADAITDGATDIHIEPYEDHIKIRYRVDGILHDAGVPATVRFFR